MPFFGCLQELYIRNKEKLVGRQIFGPPSTLINRQAGLQDLGWYFPPSILELSDKGVGPPRWTRELEFWPYKFLWFLKWEVRTQTREIEVIRAINRILKLNLHRFILQRSYVQLRLITSWFSVLQVIFWSLLFSQTQPFRTRSWFWRMTLILTGGTPVFSRMSLKLQVVNLHSSGVKILLPCRACFSFMILCFVFLKFPTFVFLVGKIHVKYFLEVLSSPLKNYRAPTSFFRGELLNFFICVNRIACFSSKSKGPQFVGMSFFVVRNSRLKCKQ